MAVHTKHPVIAPPAPPIREKTGHLILRAWCALTLVLAFAGFGVTNAFGHVVAGITAVIVAAISGGVWAAIRPPVHWRRLPWYVIGYLTWAAASIIWSAWPLTTLVTWILLAATTFQGLFLAAVLTWREIVRAIAAALKWVMALSILFELWVSLIVHRPVYPGFIPSLESAEPLLYWSRNNLLDGGRIQGIVGSSSLLAPIAILAIVVFTIRLANGAPDRVMLVGWIALSTYLFLRAGSSTGVVTALGVIAVLLTVLLMRRTRRPGQRTRLYLTFTAIAVLGAAIVWLLRGPILSALGRSADLTGRVPIWQAVLERASQKPVIGWGFATPWIPWEPEFDGWIVDHGLTVLHAHNMWFDVFLQLGAVGVVLMGLTVMAALWRSWFFAVDRPRWDLRADRPYSPLTLLPSLFMTIILVQGMAESFTPLMLWGWMLVVLFATKIKQAPHIGVGRTEQTLAIERGEQFIPEP